MRSINNVKQVVLDDDRILTSVGITLSVENGIVGSIWASGSYAVATICCSITQHDVKRVCIYPMDLFIHLGLGVGRPEIYPDA